MGDSTVSVCAVFMEGDTSLVGLRHYGPHKVLWTIPGGRCNDGETLENALRREVVEEIGVQDLAIVSYLGQVSGYKEGDLVHIFLCETSEILQLKEPEKFSEWRFAKVSEVKDTFINLGVLEIIDKIIAQPSK